MSDVMVVCTANLCRSPMAEHMLRRRLWLSGYEWSVTSAGIAAVTGQRMHELAQATLLSRGLNVSNRWRTTRFTAARAESARLILTATHEQLVQVLSVLPSAARRAFVLGQFAHLLSLSPAQASSPEELIAIATETRATIQPRPRDDDDITDPMGKKEAAFQHCAQRLDDELERVTERLAAGIHRA